MALPSFRRKPYCRIGCVSLCRFADAGDGGVNGTACPLSTDFCSKPIGGFAAAEDDEIDDEDENMNDDEDDDTCCGSALGGGTHSLDPMEKWLTCARLF